MSSDDDSSESEVVWTSDDERGFFASLGALKSCDPHIYDGDVRFFKEKVSPKNKTKDALSKAKPESMTLRDYERKVVLERGGKVSEDEDDEMEGETSTSCTNFSKEMAIKNEFKTLLMSDDSDSDELLKNRSKTEEEKKSEEEDFFRWLKGEGSMEIEDHNLKNLRKRWAEREKLEKNERFLCEYLLDKKYEVEDVDEKSVPTYEEVLQAEKEEEMAEMFEHKYNFRFEEPDEEFIKQYPRTVAESVRDKKKRRRERLLEKKRAERELLKKILSEPDDEDGNDTMRFKYRSVPANDYGLTTEEIINADDSQLNAWVSIKRVCAYKSNDEEARDIELYRKRGQNADKKARIFNGNSLHGKPSTIPKQNGVEDVISKKKKRKPKKKKAATVEELDVSRLRAYGVGTKKLRRLMYNKKLEKKAANKNECE